MNRDPRLVCALEDDQDTLWLAMLEEDQHEEERE